MENKTAPQKPFYKLSIFLLTTVFLIIVFFGSYFLLKPFLSKPEQQKKEPEYIEGLNKDFVTIGILEGSGGQYPFITFDIESFSFNGSVYEGLTLLRKGKIVPGLAESWLNPDKNTWRIKLRKNVLFHTGDQLKAKDVKYSIEQAKNNKDWVTNFIAVRIASVDVIDDFTVDLKTKNPDATLLQWMPLVFILSEEQVKRDGLDKAVGTGPYKWGSTDRKEPVLIANTGYWGGIPKIKKIKYKTFVDNKTIAEGVIKGQVDISLFTDTANLSKINKKDYRFIQARRGDINLFVMDIMSAKTAFVDKPQNPFSSKKVREALLLAIDVEELLKNTNQLGEVINQISGPELVGYNPAIKRPKVDRIKAKQLLSEAGFPDGFTVTLDLLESAKSVGEEIKKQLAEISINVNLRIFTDFNAYLDMINSKSSFYYIAYLPDTLDSFDLLNSFVHTPDEKGNGFNNFRGYSNPDFDKALDDAAQTFDTKERAEKTKKIHSEVMKEVVYLPIADRTTTYVVKEDVSFKPAPFGYIFPIELSGRQKNSAKK